MRAVPRKPSPRLRTASCRTRAGLHDRQRDAEAIAARSHLGVALGREGVLLSIGREVPSLDVTRARRAFRLGGGALLGRLEPGQVRFQHGGSSVSALCTPVMTLIKSTPGGAGSVSASASALS